MVQKKSKALVIGKIFKNKTEGMETPKEWKLDETSFREVLKTVSTPLKFYSQQDEDKYILQYAIGNRTIPNGTFLELGACDGVMYVTIFNSHLSNKLF